MYGYVCGRCGAYLDPGERCDCIEIEDKEKAAEPVRENGSEKKKRTRRKSTVLCKA